MRVDPRHCRATAIGAVVANQIVAPSDRSHRGMDVGSRGRPLSATRMAGTARCPAIRVGWGGSRRDRGQVGSSGDVELSFDVSVHGVLVDATPVAFSPPEMSSSRHRPHPDLSCSRSCRRRAGRSVHRLPWLGRAPRTAPFRFARRRHPGRCPRPVRRGRSPWTEMSEQRRLQTPDGTPAVPRMPLRPDRLSARSASLFANLVDALGREIGHDSGVPLPLLQRLCSAFQVEAAVTTVVRHEAVRQEPSLWWSCGVTGLVPGDPERWARSPPG